MKYTAFAFLLFASTAHADLPQGERKIILSSASEKVEVGKATFEGTGGTRKVSVTMKEETTSSPCGLSSALRV